MAGALSTTTNSSPSYTLSNSNLSAQWTGSNIDQSIGSIGGTMIYGGKYYWEVTIDVFVNNCVVCGFYGPGFDFARAVGQTANGVGYYTIGQILYNNVNIQSMPAAVGGDVICWAVDLVNNNFWMRVNGGNWNNSGTANPATNTGGISLGVIGSTGMALLSNWYRPCITTFYTTSKCTINFGATAFARTQPAGFSSLDSSQPTFNFYNGAVQKSVSYTWGQAITVAISSPVVVNGLVSKTASYTTKTKIDGTVASPTIRANFIVNGKFGWARQLPVVPMPPTPSTARSYAYS